MNAALDQVKSKEILQVVAKTNTDPYQNESALLVIFDCLMQDYV